MTENEMVYHIQEDIIGINKEMRTLMIEMAILKTKMTLYACGISLIISIIIPFILRKMGV